MQPHAPSPPSRAAMHPYAASPLPCCAVVSLQVRQFEASRAEFKRLSSAAFLDALCAEFVRLEGVYRGELLQVGWGMCISAHVRRWGQGVCCKESVRLQSACSGDRCCAQGDVRRCIGK